MQAFLAALFLVGVAEMADKTQLLTLSLVCRYPWRQVLLGIAISIAVLNAAAVAIGTLLGRFIPVTPLKVVAGLAFIGFGLWTLLAKEKADEEESCEPKPRRSASLAIAGAFLVAEIGDKTQLAALSLSARYSDYIGVWAGATLGMLAANGLAILLGVLAGKHLPETTMKRASAALFIGFGIWTLVEALV